MSLLASATGGPTPTEAESFEKERSETEDPNHLDISALPVLAYDPDDGLGAGATGGFYWLRPGFDPYKYGLQWEIYITTRNAHWDYVQFDWLHVADTQLRLIGVALFSATRTD